MMFIIFPFEIIKYCDRKLSRLNGRFHQVLDEEIKRKKFLYLEIWIAGCEFGNGGTLLKAQPLG